MSGALAVMPAQSGYRSSGAGPGMLRTPPLSPRPPRHPLEVHPLARLHADGRIELLTGAFPALGPARLILWHPGEDPAFASVAGRIEAGWRWVGPREEGWVVLWIAKEDPTEPF